MKKGPSRMVWSKHRSLRRSGLPDNGNSEAALCSLSRKPLLRAVSTWIVSLPHPGGCITACIAAGGYAECIPTLLDTPADHGGGRSGRWSTRAAAYGGCGGRLFGARWDSAKEFALEVARGGVHRCRLGCMNCIPSGESTVLANEVARNLARESGCSCCDEKRHQHRDRRPACQAMVNRMTRIRLECMNYTSIGWYHCR